MSKISRLTDEKPQSPPPVSGQGMDRVVKREADWRKRGVMVVVAVLGLAAAAWVFDLATGGRSLSVNAERIRVSTVTTGQFEDFIPLRGRLVPSSTVFLDAVAGGRVEEVLVEDGAVVRAGDPIAILSNTNLQLEVLGREAAVTEQLNTMRTLELQLEQNRLSHARNLVELDYQIKRLNRSIARQEELSDRNLVSQSTLDELRDELEYYESRRGVTIESQATDARLQDAQLEQLRSAGSQLQSSLALARKNLDDLNVRAPVDGQLTGFIVEVGVSVAQGGRLGQIDDPDGYKLKVQIDEFYLGRVDIGQSATATLNREEHALEITKIYPQVNNGKFEVDMSFAGQPDDVRRGQTMQVKLSLGDSAEALLIPNGTFYQETGGAWVFVVTADGAEAVRRDVRLGRRNTDFIEVLEGLEPGERVITSPYTSFSTMNRLLLNQG
ncbi:MAG: efflux RND transporter periplasmic adaptor subunit [Pseudomonadota bacterium]